MAKCLTAFRRPAHDQGHIDKNAFDDDYPSRWSTGVYQFGAQEPAQVSPVLQGREGSRAGQQDHDVPGCKDIFDSPGTFEVEVSMNSTDFTKVTAAPHTPVVPDNEACPPNANYKATDTYP